MPIGALSKATRKCSSLAASRAAASRRSVMSTNVMTMPPRRRRPGHRDCADREPTQPPVVGVHAEQLVALGLSVAAATIAGCSSTGHASRRRAPCASPRRARAAEQEVGPGAEDALRGPVDEHDRAARLLHDHAVGHRLEDGRGPGLVGVVGLQVEGVGEPVRPDVDEHLEHRQLGLVEGERLRRQRGDQRDDRAVVDQGHDDRRQGAGALVDRDLGTRVVAAVGAQLPTPVATARPPRVPSSGIRSPAKVRVVPATARATSASPSVWATTAPSASRTSTAASASRVKMVAASGGAQARAVCASMTACSWRALGARNRRTPPRSSGGTEVDSVATLTLWHIGSKGSGPEGPAGRPAVALLQPAKPVALRLG